MKRVNLDTAAETVQQFVQSLPVDPEGVELTLHGEVLCKVVHPGPLSEDEKEALLAQGRELLRQVRARNKGVPPRVIEREVREAVDEVRRRKGE